MVVLIDEHLTWNEHIKVIKNKISKKLGILYRTKKYNRHDANGLKEYIFCIAWTSTAIKKLKK